MENLQTPSLEKTQVGSATRTNFYLGTAFMALAIVLTGFGRTYIAPMAAGTFKGAPLVHFHGLLFFTWILLFITQPALIRLNNHRIHRKIGIAGFVLAVVMVAVGTWVAIISAKAGRAGGSPFPPKAFLLIPLTDMVLFASFITLSFINLNKPETHKRLMVLATVAVLPAAFGRIFQFHDISNPIVALLMQESIIVLAIVFDIVNRRSVDKVYIWGGLAMTLVHFLRMPLSNTEFWVSIAEKIMGV